MEKTTGSIKNIDENGNEIENSLFTFSPEEQENIKINRNNANLVFSPEFIPFYPKIQKNFNLTDAETKIYGFLRFYLSNNPKGRFYFTDEQIAEICNYSPDTCNRALSKLNKLGLLKKQSKMKAGGGKIRFITDIFYNSNPTISTSLSRQKLQKNNNKIKENKIKENLSYKDKQKTGKINDLDLTYSSPQSSDLSNIVVNLDDFNPDEYQSSNNSNRIVNLDDLPSQENQTVEPKKPTIRGEYGNPDINRLLSRFEEIMGFPSAGVKTKDRQMAFHLVRNYSEQQLQAMLLFCASHEYAPTIGSVADLWFKRGKIVAGIKKLQNKQPLIVKLD